MMQLTTRIFFAFIIFSILIWIIFSNLSSRYTIAEIKRELNGVILNKYNSGHAEFLVVKQKDGKVVKFSQSNPILFNYIENGDRIIKRANDNYCFVLRGNQSKKFIFSFISRKDREAFDWPKDWKNKWMDATELNDIYLDKMNLQPN